MAVIGSGDCSVDTMIWRITVVRLHALGCLCCPSADRTFFNVIDPSVLHCPQQHRIGSVSGYTPRSPSARFTACGSQRISVKNRVECTLLVCGNQLDSRMKAACGFTELVRTRSSQLDREFITNRLLRGQTIYCYMIPVGQ